MSLICEFALAAQMALQPGITYSVIIQPVPAQRATDTTCAPHDDVKITIAQSPDDEPDVYVDGFIRTHIKPPYWIITDRLAFTYKDCDSRADDHSCPQPPLAFRVAESTGDNSPDADEPGKKKGYWYSIGGSAIYNWYKALFPAGKGARP